MRNDVQSRFYCLAGIKHCGKSTLGKLLADKIGCPFIDFDEKIEELFSDREGEALGVREIYEQHGKNIFRDYERLAAESIVSDRRKNRKEPLVAALGGGIIDNAEAWAVIKQAGLIIYIDEDPEILYERIIKNGIPPFLSSGNPRQDFLQLHKRRSSSYRKDADLTLSLEGRPIDGALNLLIKVVGKID